MFGDLLVYLSSARVVCAMNTAISEQAFEEAIENGLLERGYRRVLPESYDRFRCLIPDEVVNFLQATQIMQWNQLVEHYGDRTRDNFLRRLASEVGRRGVLDVLRRGIKDRGCKFQMAYFRPSSGLNEQAQWLYKANLFSVVRQLRYSEENAKSLDMALFLNGVPVFTAELKNPLTGQKVQDAVLQYKTDRDPRDPLLAYGRCLAHFAVDPNFVYVTSHLKGLKTRFLPFNRGYEDGAGNPPVMPTRNGYATSYLWEETWTKDSVLELINRFIYEVREENESGRKTGQRFLIFPRYHQLDCVRRLVAEALDKGTGHRYLIQHSAGSGKTYTIAWLAHRLSTLHDTDDRRVFDSIVVVTDRRILDRQLQTTMLFFEQTPGVVENIDQTSRQLRDALESGKSIIVTTLQKFPVIAREVGELLGKRFALIVDEAHSSQSGESIKGLKMVLASPSLEEAAAEETGVATLEEELERIILKEIEQRGQLPNVSTFAFTATPKSKTLELFGSKHSDGSFVPYHRYSMRQAIEEGFILDVLSNYTTYKSYWSLIKKIENDPFYEKSKAIYLLKRFVDLHSHAIDQKVRIIVEHFREMVMERIGGKAKAMIVTRSRLHAVRYKLAVDKYLANIKNPFRVLVAFSGIVEDGGRSYTESGMNGLPEAQTVKTFEQPDYRFLIVANKFQTGFDQPLLHTMYVDKKLEGVNAVQTLSRLNRIHPEKFDTMVLDFENEADNIKEGFNPYYRTTILSEETDPNLLYEIQSRLEFYSIFGEDDLNHFARAFYINDTRQEQLYAIFNQVSKRYKELSGDEQHDFRKEMVDYIRLYAFLSQILSFTDPDLDILYNFCRYLCRLLPSSSDILPLEVQQNIDIESYRLQLVGSGKIELDRGKSNIDPISTKSGHETIEEIESLSKIIDDLNQRFGIDLGPEHRVTLVQIMEKLSNDRALEHAVRVNTLENIRLTFNYKMQEIIQEIIESNFQLYKKITDDHSFGQMFKELLFDQYIKSNLVAKSRDELRLR